jgi:hypothetical protein
MTGKQKLLTLIGCVIGSWLLVILLSHLIGKVVYILAK